MQSVSQHDFARIPAPNIQRSKFDRSSGFKTLFDGGKLFPIFYDEALPGDTFNLKASFFCRMNTPIVPVMDNMYLEYFFFEIPMRILWNNWKRFNGEQPNPGDSTDFLIPQVPAPAGGYVTGSLGDYFGLPLNIDFEHSAMPFRAYNQVYNEWFKDQNLQFNAPKVVDDGPDNALDYEVKSRGKRHDYFTSSLPWPQKSDSGSVTIPLGTSAPIDRVAGAAGWNAYIENSDTPVPVNESAGILSATPGAFGHENTATGWSLDPGVGLVADLSDATAATINQLRQSIAVQRLYEKDARGGTRYVEVLKAHFNVDSPDLRLQRPGFLGGGKAPVNISPIAQTQASAETTDTPQANLAAIGTIAKKGGGFTRSFTEHSIILGVASLRADLTYQRGIERSWSRQTRFDFYWPELATIGEQAVLQKEIYATGTAADDDVFGYQERFAEYRYKPSIITHKFRSIAVDSLDIWHLSQDFASAPSLGATFITDNPPIDRVVATPEEPQFKMDAYFNLKCARPMPMYGIPGLTRL